jgi:hypothetical protein
MRNRYKYNVDNAPIALQETATWPKMYFATSNKTKNKENREHKIINTHRYVSAQTPGTKPLIFSNIVIGVYKVMQGIES